MRIACALWLACAACVGGPVPGTLPPPEPPGTLITLNVTAPTTLSATRITNATWAAYQKDDGSWDTLTAADVGKYTFRTTAQRWSVVFACADDRGSLVAMYERPVSVTSLDVVLEEQCGPTPSTAFVLDGAFTHAPAASAWLDFGYGLESRGAVVIPAGDRVPYEIVNVVDGTWDLAFGLREGPDKPFSRLAFARRVDVTHDATVDVDLAGSSIPGTNKITITGFGPEPQQVSAPVRYTTHDSLSGIDLGPRDLRRGADVDLAYTTVPANAQEAEDRYRTHLEVTGTDSERGVEASFHTAFDLVVALADPMPAPEAVVAAAEPYLRLTSKAATRAGITTYEITNAVQLTDDTRRAWTDSIDATLATAPTVEWTMPDLSAVPGFDATWDLPPTRKRTTTIKAIETPAPFGDGTAQRYAAQTLTVTP